MKRALKIVRGYLYACRWGRKPHDDRRLRKGEVKGLPLPDSAYRVCNQCSRVRTLKARKKSTNGE